MHAAPRSAGRWAGRLEQPRWATKVVPPPVCRVGVWSARRLGLPSREEQEEETRRERWSHVGRGREEGEKERGRYVSGWKERESRRREREAEREEEEKIEGKRWMEGVVSTVLAIMNKEEDEEIENLKSEVAGLKVWHMAEALEGGNRTHIGNFGAGDGHSDLAKYKSPCPRHNSRTTGASFLYTQYDELQKPVLKSAG